jgi:hypothetical protein
VAGHLLPISAGPPRFAFGRNLNVEVFPGITSSTIK